MKRLDEEMHLNAFLFQDIEQTDSRDSFAKNAGTEEEVDSRTLAERKREYILRRAQIIVYQYGKKQELYRKVMILASVLCAVGVISLIYLIVGGYISEYAYHNTFFILCPCWISIMAMAACMCRLRFKKIYNIRQEIYSITVKFQTSVESYHSESRQMNLENYVVELERYVEKERRKRKLKEAE